MHSAARQIRWRTVLVAAAFLVVGGVGAFYWTMERDRNTGPDGSESCADVSPNETESLPSGPPWFRDMTAESGIAFSFRGGAEAEQYTPLEYLGGGVALLDFDGDGMLDIFFAGGGRFTGPKNDQIQGHPCKLYQNLGNWKFRDVSQDAGLDLPWFFSQGLAVADFDDDGWPDVLVTGYGKVALLHNVPHEKAGRRFVDVSQTTGLRDTGWTNSAGWADLDGDGFPELYLCRWSDWSFADHPPCPGRLPHVPRDVCAPLRYRPMKHLLFKNEPLPADATKRAFRNVSDEHGFKADGYGLGVVLADLNADGRPDIYVANDMTANHLFLNRGGKLEEAALAAGVAVDEVGRAAASMGVDVGDYDGSGRPALFVTTFQGELFSLYRNLGQERFLYSSSSAGLGALPRTNVGWGTAFMDGNNDGWQDLVAVNGHLYRQPAGAAVKQTPILLRNVGQEERRVFKDISSEGGAFFKVPAVARGLAIGDLDNDGWQDFVVSHIDSPVALLRNQGAANAMTTRWLGIKLVGRKNRDVVGSTATLELIGGRTLTAFIKGGGSYLSANDQRLVFGLGDSSAAGRLTVKWAWGETQRWEGLELSGYYELREGEPMARRVTFSRALPDPPP
jgi:hypothetical protein